MGTDTLNDADKGSVFSTPQVFMYTAQGII